MVDRIIHKRLLFKLVSYFTLITLIGAIIAGYGSIKIPENEFNKIVERNFQSSIETTENFIAFLGQTAMVWSNHIAQSEKVRSLVTKNDKEGMIEFSRGFLSETSADILILADNRGRILTKSNAPGKSGESLLYLNIARQAVLKGVPHSSIVQEKENFIIYSSGIIYSADVNNDVLGFVLLGYEINDKFLNEIKNNVNTHITIIRDRAVMASSFNQGESRLRTMPVPYISE